MDDQEGPQQAGCDDRRSYQPKTQCGGDRHQEARRPNSGSHRMSRRVRRSRGLSMLKVRRNWIRLDILNLLIQASLLFQDVGGPCMKLSSLITCLSVLRGCPRCMPLAKLRQCNQRRRTVQYISFYQSDRSTSRFTERSELLHVRRNALANSYLQSRKLHRTI